jgi:ABC-type transport system involved in resistance to organic solvents, ATPase component
MIRIVDIYKSFGEKKVLEGFSLDIAEGETMAIIGSTGSGKSVAIKHIVGLLEPDSGTVFVDNKEVPKLSRAELYALRSKIGYVFQFAALFDSMTIGDNVAMGLRKEHKLTEKEIAARVTESLALVDLPGVESKMPAELSGGMRKRVGIARGIARRPKYILYDEPTTGLDPVTSAVIDQLMVRAREARRHEHRHHPRHAERLHRRVADRDAVRGKGPPGGHGRGDQAHHGPHRPPVHRGTTQPRHGDRRCLKPR